FSCPPRDLPPFPTRRSSDLAVLGRGLAGRGHTTTAVVAYDPLVGGFQAHGLSVRKLPVGHTSLKGARALRQTLGLGELAADVVRSEEHPSELPSRFDLVCRL